MIFHRNALLTCLLLLHVVFDGLPPAVSVNPSECRSLMDLYFVIDGSDSISSANFLTMQKAIASLIPEIDLGQNKARIGMLVYSSGVPVTSEHSFSADPQYLMNAAMNMEHPRDGTYTSMGIQHMRNFFKVDGRKNVPWTCVVITDGISKDKKATAFEAKTAELMGINMFAVGIGPRTDKRELLDIASTENQVMRIDNFNQLKAKLLNMMTKICPCPVPQAIHNAKCSDGARAIGTIRNYQCLEGYLQRGNGAIRCQDDFTWTPLAHNFECVPCPIDTPIVQHGSCGGGDLLIGTRRQYVCDPGYLAVGKPDIFCQNDATWSIPDFRCIPCGETPVITHATCGGGDYTIGAMRSYTCDPGYLQVGAPGIRCLGNAQWSTPEIKCIPCGDTPTIPHGVCGGGDYTLGARRYFTCEPGYLAVGNPEIMCL